MNQILSTLEPEQEPDSSENQLPPLVGAKLQIHNHTSNFAATLAKFRRARITKRKFQYSQADRYSQMNRNQVNILIALP